MGWYEDNRSGSTHPVGQKKANDFGLYDMHGNVVEWCEDVFDRRFYETPEARQKNPVCTSGSEDRVIRGGSWFNPAGIYRSGLPPSLRYYGVVGFRPARPLRE